MGFALCLCNTKAKLAIKRKYNQKLTVVFSVIKIIDASSQIETLFDNGEFNIEKWESYINSIYDKSADIFKADLNECLDNGNYIYEKNIITITHYFNHFRNQ